MGVFHGVKVWRGLNGPGKEVFFPQEHEPGMLGESDFTHMNSLGVTIMGQPFDHLMYHLVLTYSNWEAGKICFSESFESLAEGLQDALWELGGVPAMHQTDSLSAAVSNLSEKREFTRRYAALLKYYGMDGRTIQPRWANENGDVEQRHYRFKEAVDQALMLRGSRDFASREDYAAFLQQLFARLNASRRERLAEELACLHPLPQRRLDTSKKLRVKVRSNSTLSVRGNVYSVHTHLIGEHVGVPAWEDVWNLLSRFPVFGRHHRSVEIVVCSPSFRQQAFLYWSSGLEP